MNQRGSLSGRSNASSGEYSRSILRSFLSSPSEVEGEEVEEETEIEWEGQSIEYEDDFATKNFLNQDSSGSECMDDFEKYRRDIAEEDDEDYDKNNFSFTDNIPEPKPLHNKKEKKRNVFREKRVVLRILMATALVGLALCVLLSLHRIITYSQRERFRLSFKDYANEVTGGIERNLNSTVGIAATMASLYQSNFPDSNAWPNVTLPYFEVHARNLFMASDLRALTFQPFVTNKTRLSWEAYAAENVHALGEPSLSSRNDIDWVIEDGIYQRDENGNYLYDPGYDSKSRYPTLLNPIWQTFPMPENKGAVMFNGKSESIRRQALDDMIQYKVPILSSPLQLVVDETPRPSSILFYPILGEYTQEVLGTFLSIFSWDTTFQHLLPSYVVGFVCVLCSNDTNMHTFIINGQDSEFIGEGDLHDPKYDQMQVKFNVSIVKSYEGAKSSDSLVTYRIRMYPSQAFEDKFVTNQSAKVISSLLIVFLVTAVVFFLYDFLLHRHLDNLATMVSKRNEIVNSIYPGGFRERLFKAFESKKPKKKKSIYKYIKKPEKKTKVSRDSSRYLPDKRKSLKAIASTHDQIADLFQSTTIMFADIAGFTSWSSTHQPQEVFRLLESLFAEFDRTAKKLGVFKVETIGDCYVAVCGLPDTRSDHAVVMSQFALECQRKFSKVVDSLADIGADELLLRSGLHSGSVTAGILRGHKCRFQLFGDTMNTASRMESTGDPARVQISQQTKELLDEAGKDNWYSPREELVEAKGKGSLQTYWLIPDIHVKELLMNTKISSDQILNLSIDISSKGNLRLGNSLNMVKPSRIARKSSDDTNKTKSMLSLFNNSSKDFHSGNDSYQDDNDSKGSGATRYPFKRLFTNQVSFNYMHGSMMSH